MLTVCQAVLHKPAPSTLNGEVPFYRQGHGGTGRVSSLPKATRGGSWDSKPTPGKSLKPSLVPGPGAPDHVLAEEVQPTCLRAPLF